MAIKKAPKESPQMHIVDGDPNTLDTSPTKLGDLAINTVIKTLYFAKALTGSEKWGTAGTA